MRFAALVVRPPLVLAAEPWNMVWLLGDIVTARLISVGLSGITPLPKAAGKVPAAKTRSSAITAT